MNGPLHFLERITEPYSDEPFFEAPDLATRPAEALEASFLGVFMAGAAGVLSSVGFRSAAPHVVPAFTETSLAWKVADVTADVVYGGVGVLSAWAALEGAELAWRGLKRSFALARASE